MHTLRWQGSDALVPITIKVVELERLLLAPQHRATFASSWNWADAYLCATLGRAAPRYRFLRQAMMARRALLLIDGMDEGGLGKRRTLNLTLQLALTLTLKLPLPLPLPPLFTSTPNP